MSGVEVVVTGWGAVTPLGPRVNGSLSGALAGGGSAIAPVTGLERIPAGALAARVPEPWPEALLNGAGNLRPMDRTGRLACAAVGLALTDAGIDPRDTAGGEVGLVLGTLFGGLKTISQFDRKALTDGPLYASPLDFANTVINAAAGQTAIWHHLTGPNATVAGGTTAALQAISWALDALAGADDGPLLAGGAEELSAEALRGFGAIGRLATSERPGPALGEGAAFLALETAPRAAARGATVRGRVLGAAGAFDASRGSDDESAATALRRAIDEALRGAETAADRIAVVALGASGDERGDAVERAALERVFPGPRPRALVSKLALGECLGAAGALQAILALEALAGGPALPVPPVWAGWEGGAGDRALVVARGANGPAWALVLAGAP